MPDSVLGYVAAWPVDTTTVAWGALTVRSTDTAHRHQAAESLAEVLQTSQEEPTWVDAGSSVLCGVDSEEDEETTFFLYWLNTAAGSAWRRFVEGDSFKQWLDGAKESNVGVWWEVCEVPTSRIQRAGKPNKRGVAEIVPMEGSSKFGYVGSYRSRLAASAGETLSSPLRRAPEQQQSTPMHKGILYSATGLPDNLCFMREGLDWDESSNKEVQILEEQNMFGVTDRWADWLAEDAERSGCLGARKMKEASLKGARNANARSSFLVTMLSIGHIEKAARTAQTHLDLMKTYMSVYAAAAQSGSEPAFHAWVELAVPRAEEIHTGYINVPDQTGLLRWFPGEKSLV